MVSFLGTVRPCFSLVVFSTRVCMLSHMNMILQVACIRGTRAHTYACAHACGRCRISAWVYACYSEIFIENIPIHAVKTHTCLRMHCCIFAFLYEFLYCFLPAWRYEACICACYMCKKRGKKTGASKPAHTLFLYISALVPAHIRPVTALKISAHPQFVGMCLPAMVCMAMAINGKYLEPRMLRFIVMRICAFWHFCILFYCTHACMCVCVYMNIHIYIHAIHKFSLQVSPKRTCTHKPQQSMNTYTTKHEYMHT